MKTAKVIGGNLVCRTRGFLFTILTSFYLIALFLFSEYHYGFVKIFKK